MRFWLLWVLSRGSFIEVFRINPDALLNLLTHVLLQPAEHRVIRDARCVFQYGPELNSADKSAEYISQMQVHESEDVLVELVGQTDTYKHEHGLPDSMPSLGRLESPFGETARSLGTHSGGDNSNDKVYCDKLQRNQDQGLNGSEN